MVISFSITSSALEFLASSGQPSSTLGSFQISAPFSSNDFPPLYCSMYGHVEKLAEEIRNGLKELLLLKALKPNYGRYVRRFQKRHFLR
ncbi:unnamed protein product [Microthlaspi erraticum]|uniref:Uncharacterized protein n=1 Tax=Microthlaspi erraticum TaxID=1685480 RepID=A0A6D2IP73_9BRAS|nr:unnamed protein product [Microthlaspi erraticum]